MCAITAAAAAAEEDSVWAGMEEGLVGEGEGGGERADPRAL